MKTRGNLSMAGLLFSLLITIPVSSMAALINISSQYSLVGSIESNVIAPTYNVIDDSSNYASLSTEITNNAINFSSQATSNDGIAAFVKFELDFSLTENSKLDLSALYNEQDVWHTPGASIILNQVTNGVFSANYDLLDIFWKYSPRGPTYFSSHVWTDQGALTSIDQDVTLSTGDYYLRIINQVDSSYNLDSSLINPYYTPATSSFDVSINLTAVPRSSRNLVIYIRFYRLNWII